MGQKINTCVLDISPSLTPDGKYIFFTRKKSAAENIPGIHWIASGLIEKLRQFHFLPFFNRTIPDITAIFGEQFNYQIPADIFIDDDNDLIYTARERQKERFPGGGRHSATHKGVALLYSIFIRTIIPGYFSGWIRCSIHNYPHQFLSSLKIH